MIAALPDIADAILEYRRRLESVAPLQIGDWNVRLRAMADPVDPFPFFRASFFRWLALFDAQPGTISHAPAVLGVGDLHVENFGTWRDSQGRLCWGINDFDEAAEYPYTIDLVRLAASVRLAVRGSHLDIGFGRACERLVAGYRAGLEGGGAAFVLEEDHAVLRRLATRKQDEPKAFWQRFGEIFDRDLSGDLPEAARNVLLGGLPEGTVEVRFRSRAGIGLGSLGKPRYACLGRFHGAWLAREAKRITPSAAAWRDDPNAVAEPTARATGELLTRAVRSPDPSHAVVDGWVTRRVGPRCKRIGLRALARVDREEVLLESFGREIANVHLARPHLAEAVLEDLRRQPADWLQSSARTLLELTLRDWKAWRRQAKAVLR